MIMERVEGCFEDVRKRNSSIGLLILVFACLLLFLSLFVLKSLVPVPFFIFGILLFVIARASNTQRKANIKKGVNLLLTKIGECFRLEQSKDNKTETLFDNLKWRELIIIEHIETIKDDYYDYHDVVVARQLQLRIWNEKEQIVLIEKLDKQSVDGIKVFKMKDLHKADFISLTPGTLQKMNALMNVSESIWE